MPPRRQTSSEEYPSDVAPEGAALNGFSSKLFWKPIAGLALFLFCTMYSCSVIVLTGYVGVPIRFGKTMSELLLPGLNFINPLTTVVKIYEVRPQTDEETNVDCVTNEGIRLTFDKVEIGNQLLPKYVLSIHENYGPNYDLYNVRQHIRHRMNGICANKTTNQLAITDFDQLDDLLKDFIQSENDRQNTGLKIMFVRLTKPRMPPSIEKNYLELAEQKTRKAVVLETQERLRAEKESEMIMAKKDNEIRAQKAESENEIREAEARAKNRMMILNMEARKEEQSLQDQILVSTAEAESKKTKLEAEGLSALFSIPGYAQTKVAESMSSNQKIYYGDKVPTYMITAAGNTCPVASS
jgi:regulator of protease activity HflC (stomatin/prohibitin superfamily)